MLSVLVVVFFLVLGGVYYCLNFWIVGSSVIKNSDSLRSYLGVEGKFPGPLKITGEGGSALVNRLRFLPQNEFKQTNECIRSRSSIDPFFCFEEKTSFGVMTIKIYPNEQVVSAFPKEKDRLLNLNILGILELRYGVAPERKNMFVDKGEDNYIFKW